METHEIPKMAERVKEKFLILVLQTQTLMETPD